MANNIFQSGGVDNNWGTPGNWSLGAVPTASDGHVAVFDATSPNCTVNASARVCNAIDFTGYTNTITMTNTIAVSGAITLGASMAVAGTGGLIANTTATLTSAGFVWPNPLNLQGTSQTYTLADTWSVSALLTTSAVTAVTLNAQSIAVTGHLTIDIALSGTTNISMTGTGTWSGAGTLRNNLTVNSSGTVTFASPTYNTGTLTYTAGTVTCTGTFNITLSTTLNTNGSTSTSATATSATGINFNNLTITSVGATSVITNNSNVCVVGTFSTGADTLNGSTFYLNGGLTTTTGTAGIGSALLLMQGTGTWSGTSNVNNALTFNTAGTITVSGTVSYNGATLTYTAGTMTVSGSTLTLVNTVTLATSGMTWNNVSFVGGSFTTTLSAAFKVGATLLMSGSTLTVNGAFNVEVGGGLSIQAIVTGTASILMNGTGTWSALSSTTILKNNLTFNTAGTITVSGSVYFDTGTLTYTAGTMTVTGSTLVISAACTINTNGMSWNHLSLTGVTYTITLSSNMTIVGDFTNSLTKTLNGNNLFIAGSCSNPLGDLNGTTVFVLNGTGTLSGSFNNITFNTSGTITMGTSTNINGTGIYTAGTIAFNGNTSTLSLVNGPYTLNGPVWNIVSLSGALSSDIRCKTLTFSSTATANGSTAYCYNLEAPASEINALSGTTKVVMNGTGTWSGIGRILVDLTIAPGAIVTISGTVHYGTGVFTNNGSVITSMYSPATLRIGTSSSFVKAYKIPFTAVTFTTASVTITMDRFFAGVGNIPCTFGPETDSHTVALILTEPSESAFISCRNVRVSATSPFKPFVTTINGNKGGNAGIIFINQRDNGLLDETWVDRNFEKLGYVNNWGQRSQGIVRNS